MLKATVFEEPDLIFAKGQIEKDPRLGLDHFGPYHSSTESKATPTSIRIGVVGTGANISDAKEMLRRIGERIPSRNANRWIYPDFPGFNSKTNMGCDVFTADSWDARITESDIQALQAFVDPNERIAACANLYVKKIGQAKAESGGPNVLLCILPEWIEQYCGRSRFTRGASRPKITPEEKVRQKVHSLSKWNVIEEPVRAEKDYDLRNAIKGKAMKHGLPIQVLRESSLKKFFKMLDEKGTLEGQPGAADFAWNLSTALYYKAEGRPWRLARLTPGTCYVGISFFKNLRSATGEIQFSMAQVFTHSLEGFVIRGTEVTVNERTREPFMSETQAHDLLRHAVEKYEEKAGAPSRVVVHKTSRFSEAEKRGVLKAIGNIQRDLVSFGQTAVRFLRMGSYPVLRGTSVSFSATEHALYTTGYVPRLRSYPGARVPDPRFIRHDGDSPFELVAKEILGLTKLDWNTTAFSTRLPITIGFAQSVGDVLSELMDDKTIQDHYKFYM